MSILASVQMSVTYKHSKSSPEAPSSYLSVLALFQLKNSIPYRVAKLCHIFSTSQDILSYIFLKTITALLYI